MKFLGKQLIKQPIGADLDYYGFIYEIDPIRETTSGFVRYKYLFVIERMLEFFKDKKDLQILDVGCACGIFTKILIDEGYKNILGVDYSETARKDYFMFTGREAFRHLDECNLQFDLVASIQTIEHMSDYQPFVEKCWSKVKPGGMMVITTVKDGAIPDAHHKSIFRFYDIEKIATSLDEVKDFGIYPINRDNKLGPKLDCWGLVVYKKISHDDE